MLESLQRHRRGIGAGLTAYGLLGLLAGGLLVVAVVGVAVGLGPTIDRLDTHLATGSRALQRSADALAKTAAILEETGEGVATAGDVAGQSADVARLGASTMTRLADTFGSFQVLGQQPFGPLAADATQLAAQLRGIALDLDALGIRMGSIGRQVPPLAEDLRAVSTELDTLATELAAIEMPDAARAAFAWLAIAMVALLAWLLVPAVTALVLGIWLLRREHPGATPG